MRFWRHSLDVTLHRSSDAYSSAEILWPGGEWAPDPEFDWIHYAIPMTESEAQAFADGYCGGPVDLHAVGLTDQEYAAALSALSG